MRKETARKISVVLILLPAHLPDDVVGLMVMITIYQNVAISGKEKAKKVKKESVVIVRVTTTTRTIAMKLKRPPKRTRVVRTEVREKNGG